MSEKLIIRNFGPIKDANLDIRRYMLFIGKQASGKSTIAKLLAIFRSTPFILESNTPKPDYNKYFIHYNINNYFCITPLSSTYIEYTNDNYQIIFDKSSGWRINKNEIFQNLIIAVDERLKVAINSYIESRKKETKENVVMS